MRIKYIKNGLKTSRYEAHPEWIIPLWLESPMGCLIWPDKKFNFLFLSQGSSHCMNRPKWIIPLRAMSQNEACRLPNERGWPRWIARFCANSVFHAFKIQNLSKYFQILSNGFKSIGHSQKASKTSSTCRNFNFDILDEAF